MARCDKNGRTASIFFLSSLVHAADGKSVGIDSHLYLQFLTAAMTLPPNRHVF